MLAYNFTQHSGKNQGVMLCSAQNCPIIDHVFALKKWLQNLPLYYLTAY